MLEGRIFYRYMSREEAEDVEDKGLLRGGRPGQTYWTDERYERAGEAKSRLALNYSPEVRLAFTIRNEPTLERNGTRVKPLNGEPGGGTEWMSENDSVEVEVIGVDNLE